MQASSGPRFLNDFFELFSKFVKKNETWEPSGRLGNRWRATTSHQNLVICWIKSWPFQKVYWSEITKCRRNPSGLKFIVSLTNAKWFPWLTLRALAMHGQSSIVNEMRREHFGKLSTVIRRRYLRLLAPSEFKTTEFHNWPYNIEKNSCRQRMVLIFKTRY